MVEHLPFKQVADGSIPSTLNFDAPLAQLVEQLTLNQRVEGSSPSRRRVFFGGIADLLAFSKYKSAVQDGYNSGRVLFIGNS